MPGDGLLRFIGGPLRFSGWWPLLGVLLLLAVVGWYAGIFVWTLPPARLRRIPVINGLHARVNRRRFTRVVRKIGAQYREGTLTPTAASARLSRTLRSFLYVATGIRAQYLHVEQLAGGPLAAAAPLFAGLNDARFNPEAHPDVAELGRSAEELITSWN
ncbi:hypothetical protein [Mycobacterium asiaticum]|uniref:DUF4129 domain-containing protein n=1 Tax=Mycobacterium asiaticum TaxID=1790 RepID=A0A1A3KIQ1_MYCAS|nr:hypothetical protein [Mycobacterium asiaticum]OBI97909.1 hypothetical protein A5661_16695 [Mycobacterium asiaticum]OBJ84895.1 hypothetical protein A5640_14660 [Mycobacterium asiaticum]